MAWVIYILSSSPRRTSRKASGGVLFYGGENVPAEPPVKRVVAFIDGQNLFYAAKKAFGHQFPNYDPKALAERIAATRGWTLSRTFFYTGIPGRTDNPVWHHFWRARLAAMGRRGVQTFSRSLRYRNQTVQLPGGGTTTILVGEEKGVDVRLALDLVRMARENLYDVALIFSQDQDLSEAADAVKAISVQQGRWIKVACAFPFSPTVENRRARTGWRNSGLNPWRWSVLGVSAEQS
jgi:uncharacterized LabA/DUF88 family protein